MRGTRKSYGTLRQGLIKNGRGDMGQGRYRWAVISAVAALGQITGVQPAFSQQQAAPSTSAGGLAEIVVTAERREERLQDVPISVAAFSQDKLDSQGLKSIDDLSRLSPGMTFMRQGMGSSANYNDENSDINIRGVDSTAGSPTTGIYIDDTPIQSRHIGFGAVQVYPQLFDLERVEVLRGPQGTLFGAGAEGGVVRFITPTPGLTANSGYLRAEYASTDNGGPSYEGGAAVGGPIIDGVLGFRVSVSFRHDGGWVDRVSYTRPVPADPLSLPVYQSTTEFNSNWSETATGRAALLWQVNDQWSIEPSIYAQTLNVNDTAAYWQSLSDPNTNTFRNGNFLHNPSTDPWYIAAVRANGDLGFASFVSNTSYFHRDQHSTSDYTQYLRATYAVVFAGLANIYPPPGAMGYAPFGDKQHNFYQEFRLASKDASSRLTWSGGLFFAHTNENIPENIIDPTLDNEVRDFITVGGTVPLPPGYVCLYTTIPCPNGLIFYGPIDRIIEEQLAVFGEVNFKFTDAWKLTVGLRVASNKVTGDVGGGGAFLGTPYAETSASTTEHPVTPRLVLTYQPDRDDLFYASASKGYRSGGVNVSVGIICEPNLAQLGLPVGSNGLHEVPGTYNSDSLWQYELGAKNALLDHKLQINTSIFYTDWSNIQQNVYLPICGEQFVANLGHTHGIGGDIELIYRPVQTLTFDASAAYTQSKYTQASCAGVLQFNGSYCGGTVGGVAQQVGPIVSKDDQLPGAPWTFLVSAEYAPVLEALGGKTAYFRLDYQHNTAQTGILPGQNYHNALFDTTLPGLPSWTNLQLRAGMRFGGYDLSVFANNVTNQNPKLFQSRDLNDGCGFNAAAPAPCGAPKYDNLYFARGVRPRTIGVTATYRY
jgi:outer membrane receptor protein involved in Fe transport